MSKLLFVLDIGFDRGGPSVHLLQDVIRAGLNSGHVIDVILKDSGGDMPVMPEEFINAPGFRFCTIKENDEKKYGFVRRYLNEVCYAKKCSKIFLENGKYDSVFLQSNPVAYFYIRLLKRLDCKIVLNVQDIFPYNLKLSGQLPMASITFPVFRKLQNVAYKKADVLITISDDMKQTLVNDGVDAEKIEVVYNWSYADTPIKLETIDKDNIFDLKLDHNKFNVVYAGNIGKMQNVELIAETAIKMKDDQNVQFHIIGDGANKHHIEEITGGLKNISILPMQPSKYAESIYAQADANIVPLMPGGIKTALPSKTATVLRTNKSVIFCIDRDSAFEKNFADVTGVYFADCESSESLGAVLCKIIGKKSEECDRKRYPFISKQNAVKYIETIKRIQEK